jgi:hypothetical protein
MDWRKERAGYQQDQAARETTARREIAGIKAQREYIARSLIWSTGPTMLSLPIILQAGVEYSIDVGPTYILDNPDCLSESCGTRNNIRKLIDIHASHEPLLP